MKILVYLKGYRDWVERRVNKIDIGMNTTLKGILQLIIGRAQVGYLTGPYPVKLKVGKTGNLRRSLYPDVEREGMKIAGFIKLRSIASYGAYWEDRSREGQVFKNGNPKYRPFVRPAFVDMRSRILRTLAREINRE